MGASGPTKDKRTFGYAVGTGALTRPPWQFPLLFVGAHSVRPRAAEVVGPYGKTGSPSRMS